MAGITIGTMALIVVLSVFNGFESLIVSLFDAYNPDLLITVKKGKTFRLEDIYADSLKKIPGVIYLTEVVEDNALMKYESRQYIVNLKGVSEDYKYMTHLDSMLIDGSFLLKKDDLDFAVIGAGVAYHLGYYLGDRINPIDVYVPSRTGKIGMDLDRSFNNKKIYPSGIISLHQEFDVKYVIVPIGFARELFEYTDEVTAVELGLAEEAKIPEIRKKVMNIIGEEFNVKNKFQQQELLYKIMKSEKWAIYLILTFILIVAAFNVIGSLTMLIIDKKKDVAVLYSMGASNQLIRKIFLTEGVMISVIGAILGIFIGAMICLLQQNLGLIKLGDDSGAFIIEAYPVKMKLLDFLYVFITVFMIGVAAAYYPVRRISKKYLHQRLQ